MIKGLLLAVVSGLVSLDCLAQSSATFQWSGVVPYRTYSEFQKGYRIGSHDDKRWQSLVIVVTTTQTHTWYQVKI